MGDIRLNSRELLPVKDFVRTFSKRNDDWGVEGYKVPVVDHFYKTLNVKKWNDAKND
jgi:hypothetical protein